MIRLKYILIPIIAIATMTAHFAYAHQQAAKFDSEIWKSGLEHRSEMVMPLMGYVLKVGQSREDVREKLGQLVEEHWSSCCGGGLYCETEMFKDVYEVSSQTRLTIVYSIDQKVTDFYIGEPYRFIF